MAPCYRFDDIQVDLRSFRVLKGGKAVQVEPKVLEVLVFLVENRGRLVEKRSLMDAVWKEAFVTENVLSRAIAQLRKALGDDAKEARYIETVPTRGYRFIADVVVEETGGTGTDFQRPRADIESRPEAIATAKDELGPTGKSIRTRWAVVTAASLVVIGLGVGGWLLHIRHAPRLTEKDTIVLADFMNTTGDAVFDGTLRQGLAVQLEQSPFLSIISEERIQQTLQMMGQPPDAKVTPGIAREICQRTRSAAVLDGLITQIGTQYSLILKVVDCPSGESLASSETQASDKNHILEALGKAATEIRTKLGESLSTAQKYDTPLVEATTPSLEALKAFTSGNKVLSRTGSAAAIPFFKQATEIDPNFALAYAWLGRVSDDIGENNLAADYTRKAYKLRDRASEPEKYFISASFNLVVTRNMEKAEQICDLWVQAYPRSEMPHDFLSGIIYPTLGRYEKVVEEATEAIRLNPDFPISYLNLMWGYIPLNRLGEAQSAYGQAIRRKLDFPDFHGALYEIAFLQNDATGMARQVEWSAGKRGVEDQLMEFEADTAAYSGQLGKARTFSGTAVASAKRAEEKETAAGYEAEGAVREALFGNATEARQRVASTLGLSTGRDAEYGAALALALAGDAVRAQALTDDLDKRFPEDTVVRFNYLPALRGQLALTRNDPSKAIEVLQAIASDEAELPIAVNFMPALYPRYVCGQAYLAAHHGGEAAAVFQTIVDHRGMVLNEPIGALAHLGLARAYVLVGDEVKARLAYQNFLSLWKDADPNIPILQQAQAEYGKLK